MRCYHPASRDQGASSALSVICGIGSSASTVSGLVDCDHAGLSSKPCPTSVSSFIGYTKLSKARIRASPGLVRPCHVSLSIALGASGQRAANRYQASRSVPFLGGFSRPSHSKFVSLEFELKLGCTRSLVPRYTVQ